MKALLKKISCLLISCIMFACPIYSNANYHNSLLEVHAEDSTMHYNQWLVLILASLGLSVTTLAPNPYNWVGDELEKFIKRYQQEEQERIQNALIEWKAQMNELKGKPIVEVPPILYNVFNDFVNYFEKDKGLTSSNSVTIGNVYIPRYISIVNGSQNLEIAGFKFTINLLSHSSDVRLTYCIQNDDCLNTYFVSKNPFSVHIYGIDYDGVLNNGYYVASQKNWYHYGDFDEHYGELFQTPSIENGIAYTFGGDAILDDKVIGAGDLKLDDRVLETDDKATLDLTNVNFGQGVGVDATIADISKWLNGVINGTQDLDWGKVVPIPDVKPIPIPEPTTAPLPTSEPIPTTEPVPEPTPFPPSDIEKYQTPSLTNVFPFCVPYDIVSFFGVLNSEPKAPKWTFDLDKISKGYKVVVDMSEFEKPIIALRYSLLALFIFGLILVTRRIIGG